MKINNPARSPVKESDYFTMYVQIFNRIPYSYICKQSNNDNYETQ